MTSKTKSRKLPIVFRLGETTWKVLLSLLSIRQPIGPRELSKRLNLSSPSVGLYHLEKLQEDGLVEKNAYGEYQVSPSADLGFLENYLFFEKGAIPRMTLYASFVSTLVAIYVLFVPFDFGLHNVFAIIIGMVSMTFLWYEVMKNYKSIV